VTIPNPLLLRKPLQSDASLLFSYVFGTSVVDTISWDGPSSFEEFREDWGQKVREAAAGIGHFFVILAQDGVTPAGACSLTRSESATRGEIGFWIAEAHQRCGLATLAVAQLVAHGFEVVGLHELVAEVFVGNVSSRKVLERNGFVLSETLVGNSQKRGELRDDWRFALTNPAKRDVVALRGASDHTGGSR
jgi:ribosomal-protein-alanine N-acetyltransferase